MISVNSYLLSARGNFPIEKVLETRDLLPTYGVKDGKRVLVKVRIESSLVSPRVVRQIVTSNGSLWATVNQEFLVQRGMVRSEDLQAKDVFVNDQRVWSYFDGSWKARPVENRIEIVNRAALMSEKMRLAKFVCLTSVDYLILSPGIWFNPSS